MKLVLCEGKDDVSVIEQLCRACGIAGLHIEQCGGKDRLREVLAENRKRPEFARDEVESLGVVLDAEEDPVAMWQKLRNDVQAAFDVDLPGPGRFAGERPRIAGLLVGGTEGHGMLEDLCLAALSNRPGFVCLEDYFRCLTHHTGRPTFHAKARFRAWMASQSEFELHVGKAAEQGFLPWENPVFDSLREFLKSL